MSVRRSAGAIFWGLTLVSVGGLLLANNMGYSIRIWPYVIRYWPALLIGWGLLKFVDYFRFRHAGDNRPLFTGGEIALLILVIFAGSAITTAANVSPDLGNVFEIGDFDLWDITGNNFTYDQHQEMNVKAGSEIEILNMFGSVDVRPSDSDRIVLSVKKTIRAANKDEADRLDKDFTFSIKDEGSKYRIVSNRDDGFAGTGIRTQRQGYKSSLTIQVPKHSMLHLDNRNGGVSVRDLTGNQNIVDRYGEVEVRNVTGDLQLENRNGGVTVQDVTGAVSINNRYSNTTVKNIGGSLEIDTRNGSVDVSGVKGNAAIANSYAPITVENVQGTLTITGRNNSLDVQHVEGDLKADNSYQNVNIRDPRGAVAVNSRNGEVAVSFERPPQKDVVISSRYGNVTLELPSAASFNLDARTQYGNVNSEFDGIRTTSSRNDQSLTGQTGQGGPLIRVDLRNGNIQIGKRG